MGRPKGMRFANGSKPCPDCGQLCDIGAELCVACRAIRRYRPFRTPTLSEIQDSAESTADGCLLFAGEISTPGYGVIRRKSGGVLSRWSAHRLVYELVIGPIPDGCEIHHTCGVKRCVNPDHLEPMTRREHMAADGRLTARDEKGRIVAL